ncbi:MAG: alpha/beta hydrolase [Thaumarchaeota archaeon]|nr:alpha/beta hydrolase [Nitrososphaerota archaeon]
MQEKFVSVDGNKIRYLESGISKESIVLIHGLGASAERWEYVIPMFEKHYRVIVPDLIGFGYSDKPMVDYTMEFFAEFLKDFLSTLDLKTTNLIGSSFGGQIAVEVASNQKKLVKKLVLISPSGVMKNTTPALEAYVMAALYPNPDAAKNAFEMMTGGKKVDQKIIDEFVKRMQLPNAKMSFMSTLLGLKNAELITNKLPKITSPTLVIWGENDPVIPINYAQSFVSSIRDCRFCKIPHSAHTPYVDAPSEFFKIVDDFLK